MESKVAFVLGASGLVGTSCVRLLLAHPQYTQVHVLVRSPLPIHNEKLQQHTVAFSELQSLIDAIRPSDIFCCLGTTLHKAGSKERFREVDYEYPLKAAEAGLRCGAKHFLLVSAMGAHPGSAVFYNRVKGEIEAAISSLPYRSISIFRPSLLLGHRSESRPLETLGKAVMTVLSPLMVGPLRPYRAIEASTVAYAMVAAAVKDTQDVRVINSLEIEEEGQSYKQRLQLNPAT